MIAGRTMTKKTKRMEMSIKVKRLRWKKSDACLLKLPQPL